MAKCPNNKVLCIGNICVDIKAYSPEEGNTEAYRDGSIELVPGGVGRGMAINLKHLGLDTYLYSYVGKDIFGDYLKHGLEEEKINTSLLYTSETENTSLFSVMSSAGQSAQCIYNTKIIREIDFNDDVVKLIEKDNIKAIVMDSNISDETFAKIYAYKKANPDVFVFQNATAPDLANKTVQYASLIDLFACNEYEAAAILGKKEVNPDVETADLFEAKGFKNFIITFGGQGVMVRIDGKTYNERPYNPGNIVDTIGAGDAFASGFIMGFLDDDSVKNCIHYGLACAKETLLTRQTISSLLSREYILNYPH